MATVSHELRTPLTSIQGCIETLLRHGPRMDRATRDSLLEAAGRQSRRLRHLIEDLLAVSRVESHQLQPDLSIVAMTEILEEVAGDFRASSDDRRIEVHASSLPEIQTDGEKVRQILVNLVENAIKYSAPGTAVDVEARVEGEGILLSVTDEGFGIPPEQRDQIFERFYQGDQSTTRAAGGTGLGLYICRRLATALGGRLWLERTSATGSVFCLWVPRTPPSGVFDERPAPAEPLRGEGAPGA